MLETFSITTKAGMTEHGSCDRIVEEFFDRLSPYLTEELCDAKATVFFFEDYYDQGGGRAAQGKATARNMTLGVILYLLRQSGLIAYAVNSATMVSFLVGKSPRSRAAKKAVVMEWLHHNRNFYTKNDNQADAYGFAEFGYALLIEGQKLSARALCSLL